MTAEDDRGSLGSRGPEPSSDARVGYDFVAGEIHRPDFVDALDHRIDGDVRFDGDTRERYATDASSDEQTPVGVVIPQSTADVAPGASCRTQLGDRPGVSAPPHPIESPASALPGPHES